jgi:hypothetical protein
MILVRNGGPEQRHDAVARHLMWCIHESCPRILTVYCAKYISMAGRRTRKIHAARSC